MQSPPIISLRPTICPHCRGTGFDTEFQHMGALVAPPCPFCGGDNGTAITLPVIAARATNHGFIAQR